MDYTLDDFYYYNEEEEGDWGLDNNPSPEKNKMDIAKDIMDLLESDDEVMSNFNFLLRQKKLKQLKNG